MGVRSVALKSDAKAAAKVREYFGKECNVQIVTYLNFNGDCEEAFKFYEQCLGGEIVAMLTHEETPARDQVPAEWRDRIMHARLRIGDAELMGSDSQPGHGDTRTGFAVSVHVGDPTEADRIFEGLAEGGTVHMPIAETFWAARFGMLVDRFGTPWIINCEKAS